LAGRLALPEREAKEQSVIVEAVLRWLDEQERWLLVPDNVEDYGVVRDLVRKASPNGHHVIITTQTQALGAIGRQKLLPMEQEQGAALLLRRANRLAADAPLSNAEAGEAALAREISREVGGLPLALDQAGAYLEETGCGLQNYLTLLRQRFKELAERRGGLDSDHLSVAATFLTSFEKLARQNPAAAELLKAAAFLPPDAIPEEIFTEGAAEFGALLQEAASDSLKWNDAIGAAFKLSLLERDTAKKVLVIHRMVQAVARSRMGNEERAQWAEQVVSAVNAAFPKVEFAVWDECERLVPSAQFCASLVDEYGLLFPEAASLLNWAGYYLDDRARYTEAEPLYRRSLAISEHSYGPDHPQVARDLNNLAALLKATNRLEEAEPLMRRVTRIVEKTLGPDDPRLAASLNNMAQLLQSTSRLDEAEPLMRRALEIDEHYYGPDHPDVARDLNNLAVLLKATNRLEEAEPLMWRAFEIDERSQGPDHPNVARDLNNLALLLKATNRLEEAEPLMRRVLEILERAHGSDHPNLATSLNNMALLLQDTNRWDDAEPLYRRALAIDERSYGPDHPEVAIDLNNLAALLQATNRLGEAEPLMRRQLGIFLQFTRNTGHKHPHLQGTIANYAALLQRMGYQKEQIEAKLKEVAASL
jgi:tetratricopeptide (TPR) repeat protein